MSDSQTWIVDARLIWRECSRHTRFSCNHYNECNSRNSIYVRVGSDNFIWSCRRPGLAQLNKNQCMPVVHSGSGSVNGRITEIRIDQTCKTWVSCLRYCACSFSLRTFSKNVELHPGFGAHRSFGTGPGPVRRDRCMGCIPGPLFQAWCRLRRLSGADNSNVISSGQSQHGWKGHD